MAKKKKSSAPAQAEPIDYASLMRSANSAGAESAAAQLRAQIAAYPELENLQLGTIQRIADNLNNAYTAEARAGLDRSVGDAGTIRGIGSDMRGTASEIQGIGRLLRDRSEETAIERNLRQQAENELALGRQLSAEEMRDAAQSARAAFAARGLSSSMPSVAAEILNRDQYAQARESARRNFAAATNNMVTGNVFNRFGQAGGLLGNAAQVQQGAANAYGQSADIEQLAAQLRTQIDPYARALGHSNIGAGIGQSLMQSTGQTFGNALQMAGNVASFNNNMIDSRYNAYMNNQAAMNAARMQANASRNAGTSSMWGGILQGGMGLLGGALGSFGGPAGSALGSSLGSMFGRYAASRMP